MKKRNRGIMAFKDGVEDILFIVAGYGPTSSYYQPGAQYEAITSDRVICNEQHMFSLSTSECIQLAVTDSNHWFNILNHSYHQTV